MISSKPLVSVCCISYNHESFIREAIDGFLMQKTDFPIEIIIHDDASTDGTANIIREYQEKYPQLIKTILQTENQFSVKGFGFLLDLFNLVQGKYIALCEGDDYWTDPLKLQKQVNFLEANPDFVICFHNVNIINENNPDKNRLNNGSTTPEFSTLNDLLKGANYIATASTVIKTRLIQPLPDWFSYSPFGDYALYLIAARYGKIKYINEVMGTYRIHGGGIHGQLWNSYATHIKGYQQYFTFWKVIDESGLFNTPEPRQNALKAIDNMINCTIKFEKFGLFLKYSYLLIKYSNYKSWQKVVKYVAMYILKVLSHLKIRNRLKKLI